MVGGGDCVRLVIADGRRIVVVGVDGRPHWHLTLTADVRAAAVAQGGEVLAVCTGPYLAFVETDASPDAEAGPARELEQDSVSAS